MKLFVKIISVLIAFSLVVCTLNYVTNPYNEKADRIVRGLYSDEGIFNDLDVALIGGSHGCNGFNPQVIYEKNHLTAYNFSLSGEPIDVTYYYLKEFLKKRHPSLIVFDVYYLGLNREYFTKYQYVFDIIRCLHYNKNRFDMINNCTETSENRRYGMFPLMQYHTRWSQLTIQDLLRKPEVDNDYLLGSQYYFDRNGGTEVTFGDWNSTTSARGMTEKNKMYYEKIIDLIRSENIQLLLVDLPHNHENSGAPDKWVDNEYELMNQAKKIAKEKSVDFLQYDGKVLDEINFSPKDDMYNFGHMNYWGSVKTSEYLGDYLIKHFSLNTDTSYQSIWDGYLDQYHKLVETSS